MACNTQSSFTNIPLFLPQSLCSTQNPFLSITKSQHSLYAQYFKHIALFAQIIAVCPLVSLYALLLKIKNQIGSPQSLDQMPYSDSQDTVLPPVLASWHYNIIPCLIIHLSQSPGKKQQLPCSVLNPTVHVTNFTNGKHFSWRGRHNRSHALWR